jgi:hypothetical protein
MTVTYAYDPERNRIETVCEGRVTVVEVMNHFHILALDRDIRASADVLLDLGSMNSSPEDEHLAAVMTQIERLTTRRPFGRCAVVAPHALAAESARMFERSAGRHFDAYRIFSTHAEAEAWLAR